MTVIPKAYTLANLPPEAQQALLTLHVALNGEEYRRGLRAKEASRGSLWASTDSSVPLLVEDVGLRWATDVPSEGRDHQFQDLITVDSASTIRPRVEKSKDEQRARVKKSAEVFTPSWVCNLQNNLIDDETLYPGAFNVTGPADRTWTGTIEAIKFSDAYTWASYVTENRLEMTCGEGPYLFSRYDAVSGHYIPVLDEEGRWQRIGILDRKLRVVSERNFAVEEDWQTAALYALRSTFGFEWQGDNLLLARLNMINTVVDYHRAVFGTLPPESFVVSACEVASWNLWQMDGLKMVLPASCTPSCPACDQKSRAGHDGRLALVRFGDRIKTFEELLPSGFFATPQVKRAPTAAARKTAPISKPVGLFGDVL